MMGRKVMEEGATGRKEEGKKERMIESGVRKGDGRAEGE